MLITNHSFCTQNAKIIFRKRFGSRNKFVVVGHSSSVLMMHRISIDNFSSVSFTNGNLSTVTYAHKIIKLHIRLRSRSFQGQIVGDEFLLQ